MHHFAGALVQQDIVPVAIAQAEHVTEDGDGRCAARVGEPPLEPVVRVLEALHEEVAENGVEVVRHLAEGLDALVHRLSLHVGDEFAAHGGLEVFGKMPLVCGHEVVV